MSVFSRFLEAALLFVTVTAAHAGESPRPPQGLNDCVAIPNDTQRLSCFDKIATDHLSSISNGESSQPAATSPASSHPSLADEPPPDPDTADHSRLSQYWETQPRYKRGTYAFRAHQDNYFLFAKYSSQPNNVPFVPFRGLEPEADDLSNTEIAFQLSFKTKLLEDLSSRHADLWFGYTQQSFWQAYAHRASSPFRETNYQPEVMFVIPTDFHFLGMNNEFVNIGLAHQSNGQPSTLSRSWNRWYVQTGLERGNVTVLARAWKRIHESALTDDNPDIENYLGHGDLLAQWRHEGYVASVLLRRNFRTGHGAMQAGWAFPLVQHLKGYVQAFTGYGESLIDYNARQSTLGLGLMMDY